MALCDQRVTRIPSTRRTGAGVLVIRLADIDRLGMPRAITCLLGHGGDGDARNHLVGQRHARKADDAHIVVGVGVILLTGVSGLCVAGG